MADLTFAQGADPVCLFDDQSGNELVIDSSGRITSNIQASGTALTATGSSLNTNITNSTLAVTQSGAWSVTANIGTTNGLALDATLTGGSQKTKLVDSGGTNVATVSAAGALKVDGSAVTQPVSGTVTSNIGTTNGLALDTSVTGLQVSQGSTTSGQKGSLVLGAVTTSAPSYTTAQSSPLSLDTSGRLRSDVSSWLGSTAPTVGSKTSANSIPIVIASDQGAVPVSQSGTWTVQPGNTANTTAWLVTDASLGAVSPGTVATKSALAGGQFNSTTPTLTNTQQASLQLDASGNLLVNASASTTSSPSNAGSISAYVTANKVYSVSVDVNLASTGTDNPAILIRNPNASGVTLYFYRIIGGMATVNIAVEAKIFANPTVTANGTSQTPQSRNIGGSAAAAKALVTTLPTISANGTEIDVFVNSQNNNSIIWLDDFSLHLAANNSILITGNPSANNHIESFDVIWAEV